MNPFKNKKTAYSQETMHRCLMDTKYMFKKKTMIDKNIVEEIVKYIQHNISIENYERVNELNKLLDKIIELEKLNGYNK